MDFETQKQKIMEYGKAQGKPEADISNAITKLQTEKTKWDKFSPEEQKIISFGHESSKTPQDIATAVNKYRTSKGAPIPKEQALGFTHIPVLRQALQFTTGAGRTIGEIPIDIARTGLNLAGKAISSTNRTAKPSDTLNLTKKAGLKPQIPGLVPQSSTAQKVGGALQKAGQSIGDFETKYIDEPIKSQTGGFGTAGGVAGDIAGLVIPFGEAAKAEKGIQAVTEGSKAIQSLDKAGIVGKGIKFAIEKLGKIAPEAGVGYLNGLVRSGGDTHEAKKQAIEFGVAAGFFNALGSVAHSLKIPEKLYTTIFRTSKAEQLELLGGRKAESFAKQALDRGIKGNTKQMSEQLAKGLSDSEKKITTEFEKAGNPKIKLGNAKRFIEAIKSKIKVLKASGAESSANGLESSLGAIDSKTGEITANNALALRRFLDGLRTEKSFYAQTEELGAQQAGLKEMADEIRAKINSIGGTGGAMKDYQFFIEGVNKLAQYAARTKNADALGLINSVLMGESLASHSPAGLILAAGRKGLAMPSVSTGLAQGLKYIGETSPAEIIGGKQELSPSLQKAAQSTSELIDTTANKVKGAVKGVIGKFKK